MTITDGSIQKRKHKQLTSIDWSHLRLVSLFFACLAVGTLNSASSPATSALLNDNKTIIVATAVEWYSSWHQETCTVETINWNQVYPTRWSEKPAH